MELTLEQIKNQYEGQHFDRKSARLNPKDLTRHIIALANAEGGILAIGVEDDGKVTGTNYEGAYRLDEYKLAVKDELKDNVEVNWYELSCLNYLNQLDIIYVVEVFVTKGRLVYSQSGSVYLRVSHESLKQKNYQVTKLENDIPKRVFEDKLVKNAKVTDLDSQLITKFKKELYLSYMDDIELLIFLKLYQNDQVTLAGYLLFGRDFERFAVNSRLDFYYYKSDKLINYQKLIGPIPTILSQIHDIIRPLTKNNNRNNKNAFVEYIPDFPELAWSEGIVNALVHRDYSIDDDWVKVYLHDDFIEIYSPGQLLDYVDLDNIGKVRYSRNPRLARGLSIFGWGKRNEGIDKMHAVMAKFNLNQPHFEIIEEKGLLLRLENNQNIGKAYKNYQK